MVSKSLAEKVVMPAASGPNLSKWAGLLLAGDVVVFTLSLLLGYLLGAQITWEQLFLQEHILSIVALCLVYLIILYIGELYNYYLDFRQRENIGQVILWALAAAVVAIIVFCFPTPKLLPRRFLEWQALALFQARYGLSAPPAELAAGRAHQREWAAFKIGVLTDYLSELTRTVKTYRPEALTARNIYSEVITDPLARNWFAQDLDDYLQRYDYTVIMAYARMEGVKGWGAQKKWFDALLQAVQNRKAREKVIFKVQTYDWKNRQWLADRTIKQQLAYIEAGGGRHVAYYPDDVFTDKPSALSLAPTISGRDTATRIKISSQ